MSIKRFLIGQPIETFKEKRERLTKLMGLAIFSSDALSSVAYATEEILLALVIAGSLLLSYTVPVGLAIAVLIIIVATSYYQIIHAYPAGGGAYVVAKENLGMNAGLVAGAALLIDYVMTVAVSVTAGISALTSAFPHLYEHRVLICIITIIIITVANLRGVRETGAVFSFPTYAFIGSLLLLLSMGVIRYFLESPFEYQPHPAQNINPSGDFIALFIILRAFSSGCAALTGIEAVANGVQAFKPPEARNAGITMIWLALILAVLFTGITFFSNRFTIIPREEETVLSQLAAVITGRGLLYYVIQFSTSLILILAANTSFAGFPRLSSFMAKDRYMPRQLSNLGDRLVFSNGIIILAAISSLLIILFKGKTHALIPLYAVGVFLAFTLSQAGMVSHWIKSKDIGWKKSIIINGVGAATTCVVVIIIGFTKFIHGAWMVIIAIPAIVYFLKRIHKHYEYAAEQLSIHGPLPEELKFEHHSVIVPISGVHKAVFGAIKYAKALSDDVVAVYVCLDPVETEKIKVKWGKYGMGIPLIVLESPYRSITEPLIDYIDEVKKRYREGVITVILPEFVPSKWWHHLLHNQTALIIKGILLFKRRVVATSVPFHFKK